MNVNSSQVLSQLINNWRKEHQNTSIIFSDHLGPIEDTSYDGIITYEANFSSNNLEQLQLSLFGLEDKFSNSYSIGIIIETKKRIAKRLGIKLSGNRCATGHEPTTMNIEQITSLLDAASQGRILLQPQVNFFGFTLGKTTAVLIGKADGFSDHQAAPYWGWLYLSDTKQECFNKNTLYYKPW